MHIPLRAVFVRRCGFDFEAGVVRPGVFIQGGGKRRGSYVRSGGLRSIGEACCRTLDRGIGSALGNFGECRQPLDVASSLGLGHLGKTPPRTTFSDAMPMLGLELGVKIGIRRFRRLDLQLGQAVADRITEAVEHQRAAEPIGR